MIINPYLFGVALDPDAQAFITAAGITDATQKTAINTLVVDMKGYGIWTKMKAIYPFVGGTASTHKWNLKNPLDTNAAFRLVFNGGWTHSITGALPNGTNGYANTFLNTTTNLALNSAHLSYYSRLNTASTSIVDIGSLKSSPDSYTNININSFGNGFSGRLNSQVDNNTPNTDSRGFYLVYRTASNVIKLQKNSSILVNGTTASNATSLANIFIAAANFWGTGTTDTPQYFSNRECAFASIGDGLTTTEAANFYLAVNAFQVALSRNV